MSKFFSVQSSFGRKQYVCRRLQYEIHFILCSCKIESSERKKTAGKHGYDSFEYCEMEPLLTGSISKKKEKETVTRRKENRQIGV